MLHNKDMIKVHAVDDKENVTLNMKNIGVNKSVPLYDDVQTFKEIVFQSDSEDEFTEGKRLTSLVRESYLKHVRQLLAQNYKVWCDSCINAVTEGEENICLPPVDIERCTRYLEQKALRSCMMASLYQKSMVSLISNIKEKTRDLQLFDSLNKIEELNSFTCDKFVQTDYMIEKCDFECQTVEIVMTNERRSRTSTSLLDLPLPNPKDVLQSLGSDFIERNSTDTKNNQQCKTAVNHIKRSVPKVVPQPVKPVCRVIAKRPSCDDFPSESKRRKQRTNSNEMAPVKKSSKEVINNFDLICMLTDSNKIISDKKGSNNDDNLIDIVSDLIDFKSKTSTDVVLPSNNLVNKTVGKPARKQVTETDEHLLSLDERLADMGILINEDSNSFDSPSVNSDLPNDALLNSSKGHRCSWFVQMTAHYCNLAKIFLSLSDYRKSKIKGRFIELFGSDDDDDENNCFELTEENLSICRKRTANIVVAGLTPYFVTKRIASRHLFKEFAKRITNSILSRTYATDSRAVNQFITEYFNEHNSIQSIADIDFD